MKHPKPSRVDSPSYRRYVATQPCYGCGIEGYSQCAHANYGKGAGTKTSDYLTFPLCAPRPGQQGCHAMHDQCVGMTRDERRDRELRYVVRMQAQALRDNRPEITG